MTRHERRRDHQPGTPPHSRMVDARVVVCAAYPLVLDGLAATIGRSGPRFVAPTTDLRRAVELALEAAADLVVVDGLGRGLDDVLDCVRAVRAGSEARAILVAEISAEEMTEAFAAGVFAILVRSAHPADLFAAMHQAFGSSLYLAAGSGPAPTDGAEAVAALRNGGDPGLNGVGHDGAGGERRRMHPLATVASAVDAAELTTRELEILRLVASGRSNGELARKLWVTEQTVKFHLSNVYRKLKVANRTEASRWALLHGLLDPPVDAAPAGEPPLRPALEAALATPQPRIVGA